MINTAFRAAERGEESLIFPLVARCVLVCMQGIFIRQIQES